MNFILFLFFFLMITKKEQGDILSVYFGVPGSGKSTFAASLAKKSMEGSQLFYWLIKKDTLITVQLAYKLPLNRPENVYSNVAITGTYILDPRQDLGSVIVRDGRVIIDEAGIEFNSREFKNFQQKNRVFFKMFRHEGCKVDVFSQTYDDMDKTIRALAHNFYIVKQSIFPYFIVATKIKRSIGVDGESAKICDKYQMGLPFIDTKYVFAPSVWHLFNTHSEIPDLEPKKWEVW